MVFIHVLSKCTGFWKKRSRRLVLIIQQSFWKTELKFFYEQKDRILSFKKKIRYHIAMHKINFLHKIFLLKKNRLYINSDNTGQWWKKKIQKYVENSTVLSIFVYENHSYNMIHWLLSKDMLTQSCISKHLYFVDQIKNEIQENWHPFYLQVQKLPKH